MEDGFITFECNGRGSGLCFDISVDCNYNSGLNLVKYILTCNWNPKKSIAVGKRCIQCGRINKYEDDKK